jgi:cell division protein FtsZ
MKEFEEVGGTVSDLASEDATVVMGTVIDPDLGDDLRVTVVATGLGEPIRSSLTRERPFQVVANGTTGRADVIADEAPSITDFDRPREHAASDAGSKDLFERQKDIDYLDIPSFLRTQAD